MLKIKSTNWVEILSIIVLVIGMIITIFSPSKVMFYIISFLSGSIFGRLIYRTQKSMPAKYYFIITAYLIGLLIGNAIKQYGNIIWPIILFLSGTAISFKLHEMKLIKGIDY